MTGAVGGLLVLASIGAGAQHWPGFRGPQGRGTAEASLPTAWNAASSQGVRWHVAVPGLSHASPVVWGNRAYALSAIAEGSTLDRKAEGVVFAKDTVRHEWVLHCVDVTSGRREWARTIHTGTPRQARHVRGTYANATPATNGSVVVVSLANEGLFGFDMEGRRLWHVPMAPPKPDASLDPASSPVIVGDVAVVQNDWSAGGFAAAYDLKTGTERWKVSRAEGLAWSTPGVWTPQGGAPQVVFNSARWIRGHDAATGRELWRLDNRVEQPWDRVPTPVPTDDVLLVGGGGPGGPLLALKPGATGELAADSTQVAWRVERGAPYLPTPLAHRGLVYAVADNGILAVYRQKDGSLAYRSRIAPDTGTISASPVAAGDHIYFSSQDGDVFVVRAGESFELLGRNPMGAPIFATPAIAQEQLIVRTSDGLYGIGRR